MTFFSIFLRTLIWRPHRALASLYWYATGRRVRARNRLRIIAAQSPHAYDVWIDSVECQADTVATAQEVTAAWQRRPSFTIVVIILSDAEREAAMKSLAALSSQCLPDWRAVAIGGFGVEPLPIPADPRISLAPAQPRDAGEAIAAAIDATTGDYIVPLAPGAMLPPTALFRYAAAAVAEGNPQMLFGDQDEYDRRSRRVRPWFKPQWNEEMFLAQDYISSACAIRTDAARAAGAIDGDLRGAALYRLLLAVATAPNARVVRVPFIQCHVRDLADGEPAHRARAVARHLEGSGAVVGIGPFRSVRVQWPLPDTPPRVSIIVPTRDKVKLLRSCVTGILSATRYPDFELIVVDNGSTEPESLKYLDAIAADPRVRVLRYDRPYNFSAINNFAVREAARGDYLCLLNNDTDVLDDAWLTELMRYAVRPHVGAVGAKLLYDDGSIQHAGVIVGMGEAAGHAHRFLKGDDPGYFRQAHVPQYVSAVTAACLVVETRKFLAVGGLDEDSLQIAFNDVDLCMKLLAAGWRNVYAPQAVMIHHESKSRGRDHSPEHIERYMRELAVLQARWGTKTREDPLHHPNLERSSETFLIRM